MTTRRTSKRGGPGGAPRDREITDLREAYRQQGRRFELLTELSRRLASTLDPGAVLKEVVDAACELTDARYGALGVFDASGRIREFTTHGVTENERARIGDLPEGRGLLGWLQEHQEPLRVAEIGAHARSVGFPPNHPPMKTFLGVPIRHEGEALGNLYLTEKKGGGEFTGEDESLLVMLAAQAALAIRNVRLLDEAETERSRLRAMVDLSPV
ncbi:MAG: GAF domain-containing protein, partial [Chloroflexi bacterium]|nr:GAF domain-containing protein [Chloroflexota bacterium]